MHFQPLTAHAGRRKRQGLALTAHKPVSQNAVLSQLHALLITHSMIKSVLAVSRCLRPRLVIKVVRKSCSTVEIPVQSERVLSQSSIRKVVFLHPAKQTGLHRMLLQLAGPASCRT